MGDTMSNILNWIVANGSASEWLTAIGTVGAVCISLFLSRKPKSKVMLRLKKVYTGNQEIIIPKSTNDFGPSLEIKIRNTGNFTIKIDELVLILFIDGVRQEIDFNFYFKDFSLPEEIEEYSQQKLDLKISQIMKHFRLNPKKMIDIETLEARVLVVDQFNRLTYSKKVNLEYYLVEYKKYILELDNYTTS